MAADDQTPDNATMFQAYEWNLPTGKGSHWKRLQDQLPALENMGISNIWLPPGCKAGSAESTGFDIYDLYDLGEFDQKGQRPTKYGTKEELLALCAAAKDKGIGVYWDAVLNHKGAADKKEKCIVVEVDSDNRNKVVSDPYEITAWLGFDFPGRGDKYSAQKYHWYHFSGTDYDASNNRSAIFQIQGNGKGWSETVDDESGNADFLMFADLDYNHPEVQDDVKNWGKWIVAELGLKGFRLDAVQHFSQRFTNEWIEQLRAEHGDLFYVGEFWDGDAQKLADWINDTTRRFSLFDAPLLYKFSTLSKTEAGDLRGVFDNTLVSKMPVNAVGQTVETVVEDFFKPLAHALILLRNQGYPCVFYGDLYGTQGEHAEQPSCSGKLPDLVLARKLYAYGRQDDYFDQPNCIGFARLGTPSKPAGLACVLSNAAPGQIDMYVGEMHAGETWTDVLGWSDARVEIRGDGRGLFPCGGTSVSVFVRDDAAGRERFPVKFDANLYGE